MYSLVAACFLEHWKRRQMCLKHTWDLTSLEDEEVQINLDTACACIIYIPPFTCRQYINRADPLPLVYVSNKTLYDPLPFNGLSVFSVHLLYVAVSQHKHSHLIHLSLSLFHLFLSLLSEGASPGESKCLCLLNVAILKSECGV